LLGVCDSIQVMRRGVLGAPRETAAWTPAELLAEAMPTAAPQPAASGLQPPDQAS
jgi:hypothetical protein